MADEDVGRAFQLCQNGAEAELASMLQSRSIDAAACQTTGMYSGWSLLHAAASKGHMRIVQMLLAAGAPASACNPKSKTPAQVAHEKGHSAVAALLQQAEASPGAAMGAAAAAMAAAPTPQPPRQSSIGSGGGGGGFFIAALASNEAMDDAATFETHPVPPPQMGSGGGFYHAAQPPPPPQHFQPPPLQFQPPPQQFQPSPQHFPPPPQHFPPPPQHFQPPPQHFPPPPQQFQPPPQQFQQPPQHFQPPPQLLLQTFHPPSAPPVAGGFLHAAQVQSPPMTMPHQPAPIAQPPPPPPPPLPPPPPVPQPPLPPSNGTVASILSFAPPAAPPVAPPAAPRLEDERAVARAAVEDELRAHAAEVHSGHYLTVLPKTALPTLLGASNTRMAELCASTGARVEIGETAAGLVWVRIGASVTASGLAVLWTALGAAADADACGAGLPLLPLVPPGTAPSALIPPSVLQATQAASGAQIAASADVVLMSAHKGALHTALLLLLRDALGVAACTTREALLFTAFPPTLARLRQSLTELPPAAAASTCLMVEPIRAAAGGCAGSGADLHDEWGARRAVMWAERAHLEAAAEGSGGATLNSGSLGQLASHGASPPRLTQALRCA